MATDDRFDPASITRPDPALMNYYVLAALCTVFGFPFVILPLYFKYHTMRYRFDDKGVSMSYGILFRRETYLTYRRIQDIHLTKNIVQRWMGLASLTVQTASSGSGSSMVIEGIRDPERLRDFLYAQMRGARDHDHDHAAASDGAAAGAAAGTGGPSQDEALALLREIRDDLRRLRESRSGA